MIIMISVRLACCNIIGRRSNSNLFPLATTSSSTSTFFVRLNLLSPV